MGLMVDQSDDASMTRHGGSLFGYQSNWFAIHSAGVGAVVLTNSDDGFAQTNLFKRKLKLTQRDQ